MMGNAGWPLKTININVHWNGDIVEREKHVRFLELELDENLSWAVQCQMISFKLNSYNFLISYLRTVLSQKYILIFLHSEDDLLVIETHTKVRIK